MGTVPFFLAEANSAKTRWTMRLSTSSIEFSFLSVEKACEQIAALGFEAVDFWNSRFQCPHLDEIEKRLGPEGLKELLARCKLKLYAFSYLPDYAHYAELIGKAGGCLVVRSSRAGRPQNVRAEMKAFLEGLKPQIELAEKNNSHLAVENHGGALLDSPDSLKAFVDMNRNPRLGIALAPFHLQARGASVPEAIGIAGRQLFFFYAWQHADLKKNPSNLNQLPGIGPTDFTPWIAALAKANYRWYVNPFMHGHPATDVMVKSLTTARDYLKKCYNEAVPA
jgi:sugar phosphate isomerase/epimerase